MRIMKINSIYLLSPLSLEVPFTVGTCVCEGIVCVLWVVAVEVTMLAGVIGLTFLIGLPSVVAGVSGLTFLLGRFSVLTSALS